MRRITTPQSQVALLLDCFSGALEEATSAAKAIIREETGQLGARLKSSLDRQERVRQRLEKYINAVVRYQRYLVSDLQTRHGDEHVPRYM